LEQMDLYTTFRMRRSRGETYIGRGLLCLCVCLSLAAFSYCCTDQAVSWGMHGSCALLGEFAIGARISLLRVRCGLSSNIKHYRTLLLLLTVTLSLWNYEKKIFRRDSLNRSAILRTVFMTSSHLKVMLFFLPVCGILLSIPFPTSEQNGTARSLTIN